MPFPERAREKEREGGDDLGRRPLPLFPSSLARACPRAPARPPEPSSMDAPRSSPSLSPAPLAAAAAPSIRPTRLTLTPRRRRRRLPPSSALHQTKKPTCLPLGRATNIIPAGPGSFTFFLHRGDTRIRALKCLFLTRFFLRRAAIQEEERAQLSLEKKKKKKVRGSSIPSGPRGRLRACAICSLPWSRPSIHGKRRGHNDRADRNA